MIEDRVMAFSYTLLLHHNHLLPTESQTIDPNRTETSIQLNVQVMAQQEAAAALTLVGVSSHHQAASAAPESVIYYPLFDRFRFREIQIWEETKRRKILFPSLSLWS